MKVYIGVVESEIEYGECRDSIQNIQTQTGDIGPVFIRATKGYEARQQHFNNWLTQTDCEYMLLLDGDMIFPKDTLEKLRAHNLPYVSGAYLRRTYAPAYPVWFEPFEDGFPLKPWTQKVEPNKLYKIGASGWGCILIHREVADAVEPLLKGEAFVIEDDMDLYPYDLSRIMNTLHILDNLTRKKNIPANALHDYVEVLKEEIRPLRGVKDMVGSDIRFPFFANMAGYDLWLDTGVMCGHMLNYNLQVTDYLLMDGNISGNLSKSANIAKRAEKSKLKNKNKELNVTEMKKRKKAEGVKPSEVR